MGQDNLRQNLRGLSLVKQTLPDHLHPYASIIVCVVNSQLEWLEPEDRAAALRHGAGLLNQAWQARKPSFTEAHFRKFAALRMLRLIDHFRPEIAERQRANRLRWDQKNERDRSRDEQWREIHASRIAARRPSTQLKSNPSDQGRALAGLLQLPTDEEQLQIERGYGVESVVITYGASTADCPSGTTQVRYAYRLVSAMRLVDKLRLLLPEREREMLHLIEEGASLVSICGQWSISRARGTQLKKQALTRMRKYLERLAAGETYADLLAESRLTNKRIDRSSQTLRTRENNFAAYGSSP